MQERERAQGSIYVHILKKICTFYFRKLVICFAVLQIAKCPK